MKERKMDNNTSVWKNKKVIKAAIWVVVDTILLVLACTFSIGSYGIAILLGCFLGWDVGTFHEVFDEHYKEVNKTAVDDETKT